MLAESSSENSAEQQAQEVDLAQQSTLLVAAAQTDVEQQPTQEMDLAQQSTLLVAVAQKDVEQQAQEVDIEQRSTLLMPAAQKDVEQQSTQPMVLEQHPDQQATSPIAFRSGRRFSKATRMLIPLWLGAILIAGLILGEVLTGHAAVGSWLSHIFTHNAAPTVVVPVQRAPITPPPSQASLIDSVTVDFMDAMMHKDWDQMWSMLAPAAQQLWQGEKDFRHFEQAKFGSLKLVSFQETPAQIQLSWLDPETTQVYPDVATQQVSLEATAPPGLLTGPSNTALDNGLFNNTPLPCCQIIEIGSCCLPVQQTRMHLFSCQHHPRQPGSWFLFSCITMFLTSRQPMLSTIA